VSEKYQSDVLVVGGGPAGLSAASWCAELGLDAILVERAGDIGGQLHEIHGPIENYLGLRTRNGEEMLSHFRASVDGSAFRRMMGCDVLAVDPASSEARLTNGDVVRYRGLIIATGVRRRKLGVEGETEFRGKGVIGSGVRDRDKAADRNVVIVGGGDAAIENALIMSDVAASVKVIHRRDEFRARPEFLEAVGAKDNVELVLNSVVKGIEGDANVTGVEVEDVSSGRPSQHSADIVLIRIGVEPNSEFVRNVVALDDRGYIEVGSTGRTNVAGIYAAGDVANPSSPTLSTASGMGATAAKAAYILIKS
jgi:thioredoxin reductase (NADPH)